MVRPVAIFADAGYLHTGGAIALTGVSQPRERMDLNLPGAIAKLKDMAAEKANAAPLLRIYWYDGLLHGRPSLEQESLAYTDDVKVRLGTVTAGQQKGVDSLIVTDLIELARNHAISDAVLLSGDEDLRIGVQIAQSFGVRVHLIGIQPSRGNQSRLLRQEADTTGEWSKDDIEQILSVKPDIGVHLDVAENQVLPDDSANDAREILDQVVTGIVNSFTDNELRQAAAMMPQNSQQIPGDYDRRLLIESRRIIGRDLDESEKLYIRSSFRKLVTNRD